MKKIINNLRLFLIKLLGATANEAIKAVPVEETKKISPPQKLESITVTPEDIFIDIKISEVNIQYREQSIKNQLTRAIAKYIDRYCLVEELETEEDYLFIDCKTYVYRCYFSFMPKEYLEFKYKINQANE